MKNVNKKFEVTVCKTKMEEYKKLKRAELVDVINFVSKIIPKTNLSLCRMKKSSKYVRNLLKCFRQDTLLESFLKCLVNRSNKRMILDSNDSYKRYNN